MCPTSRFQKMLDREHGGMNEVLRRPVRDHRTSRATCELARRFSHRALLDPARGGRDKLDGLHSNTQIPKVIGFSRIVLTYAATGETTSRRRASSSGRPSSGNALVRHRRSRRRRAFLPDRRSSRSISRSAKTMETCCTHNMLRLTRSLYARDPRAEYIDYFERALFNGILASQDPETGMMTYFQSTRPGYVRLYHTPFDSFWCCTGSGIENHARYGESIYAHDDDIAVRQPCSWPRRSTGASAVSRSRRHAFPGRGHHAAPYSTVRERQQLTTRDPPPAVVRGDDASV